MCLSVLAAGVDDALGDVDEFCLILLREPPQQLEGANVVHAEAFHDDAFERQATQHPELHSCR